MRVLLVEDDVMIGETLAEALQDEAYTVDWVKSGQQALSALKLQHYDLLLLDLGLPEMDGMEVLRSIRAAKLVTPVLILTARDALQDRISGLDAGADDYVIKPFDLAEVLARMRVLIRRSQGKSESLLRVGELTLDSNNKKVTLNGQLLEVTAKEYMLLHTFMLSPDKVFAKKDLEDSLYGWGMEVESNAVEFLIHSLRKKLAPEVIKNVRGVGWLAPRVDAADKR